jgi:PAS domain S-box-containing protein
MNHAWDLSQAVVRFAIRPHPEWRPFQASLAPHIPTETRSGFVLALQDITRAGFGLEVSPAGTITLVLLVTVFLAAAVLLGLRLRWERAARLAAEDAARRSGEWLQDSQKLLGLILDSSGVGITLVDRTERLVYVNRTFCKISGRFPADLVGQQFETVLPPHQRSALSQIHAELFAGRMSAPPAEWLLVRPDGSERAVLVSHRVLVRGDGQRFRVDTVMDLTDRKRAEQGLRERDLQLQRSMDVIPGVFYQYRLAPDGRQSFGFISQGAREIWGISPEEAQANVETAFSLYLPDAMNSPGWHAVFERRLL